MKKHRVQVVDPGVVWLDSQTGRWRFDVVIVTGRAASRVSFPDRFPTAPAARTAMRAKVGELRKINRILPQRAE